MALPTPNPYASTARPTPSPYELMAPNNHQAPTAGWPINPTRKAPDGYPTHLKPDRPRSAAGADRVGRVGRVIPGSIYKKKTHRGFYTSPGLPGLPGQDCNILPRLRC